MTLATSVLVVQTNDPVTLINLNKTIN